MTRFSPTPSAGPPRPVRHAPARPYIVVGSGVVAAILLLIVVFNISSSPNAASNEQADVPPTDIEVFGKPSGLTDEDLAASGERIDPNTRLSLDAGGWIQVPNDTGGVAQQYKFARLEPDPPGYSAGWVQMEKPVAEIYVASDRLLLLEADEAIAFVPRQALESGTMTGNVTIRLYETKPGARVNPATDRPSLVVRTGEASFNNILGELRCPADVHVETPDAEFPGRNLHMLINDRDQMVQSMTVEQGEFIRIAGQKAREARDEQREPSPDLASAGDEPTPPPSSSAPQNSTTAPPSARKPEPFYRLTLHENVSIAQGSEELARGDSLVVTFSFRSRGDMIACLPHREHGWSVPGASVAMNVPQHLAAAALASWQDRDLALAPPPSDDDIYIYWDGPLTMEPVTDPAQRLASPDDARMELFGSPLQLAYDEGATTVSCASLAYHTLERKPILVASAEYPGLLVRQTAAAGNDAEAPPTTAAPLTEELRITWGKALKLDFFKTADGSDSNRLRRAKFTQDVNVISPDLKFRGDTMVVEFFGEETERDAIKTVLATGNIKAVRPGGSPDEDSQLTAQELLVEFALNGEKEAYPRHVRATGNVEAMEKTETMWADFIDVVLRERTAEEQAKAKASLAERGDDAGDDDAGIAGLNWGNDRMGETELETLTASDDVQLLLEGGTRVWADKLDVDGVSRSVTLTGEQVLIASGNHIVDKGKHIKLQEIDEWRREVTMDSPGVFVQMSGPVLPRIERRRIERPVIKDQPQVSVRWTERMEYAENTQDKTSTIEFHGQVDGRSEPNSKELSTVTADTLRFDMIETEEPKADQPANAANANAADGQQDMLAGNRTLRSLYAAGDAKIESRTWLNDDRSDTPRVFYIAGDEIEYDDVALNAAVTGKGTLLILDERPKDEDGNEAPAPDAGGTSKPTPFDDHSFGSRGTTLFRFTEGMRMTQQMENRFIATFKGDVEWMHKAIDGRTATMTGQQLEAVIARRSEPGEDVDMDFGGAAELQRITGKGAVIIRSTAYDYVECEEFMYDPATGIAELAAKPGKTVAVLAKDAPRPFHAERIRWDMNADTMRIVHGGMDR